MIIVTFKNGNKASISNLQWTCNDKSFESYLNSLTKLHRLDIHYDPTPDINEAIYVAEHEHGTIEPYETPEFDENLVY